MISNVIAPARFMRSSLYIYNEFVKSWEQQNKRMGDESVVNNKHNKRDIINKQCTDIVIYLRCIQIFPICKLFISLID